MTNEWVDFDNVKREFDTALSLPAFLDKNKYPKYEEGHVFDEEKSVKWNREEVQRLNALRESKESNLQKARNNKFIDAVDLAKAYIRQEVFCNEKQADIIWNFINEEYHYNMAVLYDALENLTDLFKDFVQAGKEG